METIAERLKVRREELALSQIDLAQRAGVSPGTIGNIESGTRKNPRELLAIARVLGVHAQWLKDGKGPRLEGHENTAEHVGRPRTLRRTPVVGTAKMGDEGYYEELQHPAGFGDGFVDGYSSDPNAYALRVKGDSMHPAIRHGSFVVVEPNGSPVAGEYVVIALRNGARMVKELILERTGEIVIESVNGNHRKTVDRTDIEWIHPVAAVVLPSKWRPD